MGRSKISEMTWRNFYWDYLSGSDLRASAKKYRISQSGAYQWLKTTDAETVKIRTDVEREVWSVMNQVRAEKLAKCLEKLNDDYLTIMVNISDMMRIKTEDMAQKTKENGSKEQLVRKREAIRGLRKVTERDANGNPVLDAKSGQPVTREQMVFTERAVENDLEALTDSYQKLIKPLMEMMSNAQRQAKAAKNTLPTD